MVAHIVIAGVLNCELFAQVCVVAGHLSQNLPNFCFERIEKSVLDWKMWLCKINQKNKWHHCGSPLIWKELLMKGSKPHYIGGAPEFFDYCNSYYEFRLFFSQEKFKGLLENTTQFQNKIKEDVQNVMDQVAVANTLEEAPKTSFIICISGAGHPLAMHLISGLLEMSVGDKTISKIYIFDQDCSNTFMEFVERECSYIQTNYSGKVVKFVPKIGMALTSSDLFIILDHVPFDEEMSIGDWLNANKKIMNSIALMINASALHGLCIILPNLGPACYNASHLRNQISDYHLNDVVVATSDIGLEILPIAAEIAEIPLRNIFCPPVWGFVGINHLVDIRTTVHKYNSFEPYNRFTKVKNSTLFIGSLKPEMRTLEYLMYFDETLWRKVAEKKSKAIEGQVQINKAVAVLDVVKLWLFDKDPNNIVNLGIGCNGSFGLNFGGVFSQPVRFKEGQWTPASDFMMPKDSQMKLPYLEQMAEMVMNLQKNDLPKINPYCPCICKKQYFKKKGLK